MSAMQFWTPVVAFAIVSSGAAPGDDAPAEQGTPVEHVTEKARSEEGSLGTQAYTASEQESRFYDRLDPDKRATGGFGQGFDIAAHDGQFVGWFGIVRQIEEDSDAGRTTLTVEHKYFDGLTDTHILSLSFNGSGDFQAMLQGVGRKIEPLSLVKVYGIAATGEGADLPRIQAEFVRQWHWGTFTFLATYGEQRGSEAWRKLNRVELSDIYDPDPSAEYYRRRLGNRPIDEAFRRRSDRRCAARQRLRCTG
jgi:hypothetical protein